MTGLAGVQVEAVAAFLADAAIVVDGFGRDVDDVDEGSSGVLAGAAGGEIVGVAGYPEMGEAVAAGEGREQQNGAGGEAVSAKRLVNAVADVAGIAGEVLVPSEAEIDVAGFGAGGFIDDGEEAGRDLMDGVRGELGEGKTKGVVFEGAGIEGRGDEGRCVWHEERITGGRRMLRGQLRCCAPAPRAFTPARTCRGPRACGSKEARLRRALFGTAEAVPFQRSESSQAVKTWISGVKARTYLQTYTARLKPCPFKEASVSQVVKTRISGVKARTYFADLYGTTEVVPFQRRESSRAVKTWG